MNEIPLESFLFKRGDLVCKPKGYEFDGTVVAAYHGLDGRAHYVVEHATRWQHIFNGEQLQLRDVKKEG